MPAYYPGNSLNQMIALENTRWEDFDYTYLDEPKGNPMGWLGNGYTTADYDGNSSRTTYLDLAKIDYPPVPQDTANAVHIGNRAMDKSAVSVRAQEIGSETVLTHPLGA